MVGFEVDIEAPVERLWALLEEDNGSLRWVPRGVATRFEDEARGPDLFGARFQQTVRLLGRVWRFEGDVPLYEPPWQIELCLDNAAVEVTLRYGLLRLGTGSRLTFAVRVRPKRWSAKLAMLVVRPMLGSIAGRHVDELKRLAEDSPQGARWRPLPTDTEAVQGELFGVGEEAA